MAANGVLQLYTGARGDHRPARSARSWRPRRPDQLGDARGACSVQVRRACARGDCGVQRSRRPPSGAIAPAASTLGRCTRACGVNLGWRARGARASWSTGAVFRPRRRHRRRSGLGRRLFRLPMLATLIGTGLCEWLCHGLDKRHPDVIERTPSLVILDQRARSRGSVEQLLIHVS